MDPGPGLLYQQIFDGYRAAILDGRLAAALADVAATLFPQSLIGPVRGAVNVGAIGGIALVNIGWVPGFGRALAITMLSTTILYVAIQLIAQGILGSSLATSKAPLADAMAHIHPALHAVMLAGTALSMFGWLGSDILGSPRQLFAFARECLLPCVLPLSPQLRSARRNPPWRANRRRECAT